ncbi:MAG: hypothetical protein RLZZ241_2233 [Bacteroidota bacterium]
MPAKTESTLQEIPQSELCSTLGCSFGPPPENAKTSHSLWLRGFLIRSVYEKF